MAAAAGVFPQRDVMAYNRLTLSPLKPSFSGGTTDYFQKIVVHTVLELCTRCRYQHMLLFHVVYLISCLEVNLASR